MTRIGVVGAGRVGAVLASAFRAAGHEIVAVAGESAASRTRIEMLLPGVRVDKPTAVSRACDLLLLTVPDDMLANVVTMLSASGAIRPGQQVVHTSGKHGLAVWADIHVGVRCVESDRLIRIEDEGPCACSVLNILERLGAFERSQSGWGVESERGITASF